MTNTCDCDANAVLSYAAMRWDLQKAMETFKFPSQDEMIEELQAKNLGYDFQKGKHTITKRTPLTKLKLYYLADKLSKNLGDISKVEKLPNTDFWVYSYPCTDLSVAGKGEGMVNKCDKCDHTWSIDFEDPKSNNVCPNCGNIDIKSTRSGLLGQVQRLLTASYEEGTLPKYLLLENVKNLVGKKFKPQFDAWLNWLDLIGYNTYYQVLNGKKYGIPQNRERVFAISIRKDVDTDEYKFPEEILLKIRLKDMLETDVDEKYYLPDERIEKILNSSFMQEKKRIQMTDVCDTLLARDYKDPKCVPVEEDINPIRIGGLYDDEKRQKQAGAIFDKDAISPALTTMEGGNRQPLVIDEIKVVGNYMPSNHDASRVVDIDGIAPTVKENHGTVTAIAEPQVDIKERFFRQVAETILENECEPGDTIDAYNKKVNHSGVSPTITTRPEGFKTAILPIVEEAEPFIVASRGRYSDDSSDETVEVSTEQKLEPNFSGCTNTLTSVQKDNYVCEPIAYDEQNEYIRKDGCVGTITTDGSSPKHNNRIIEPQVDKNLWTDTQKQMITEDGNIKRYIDSDVIDEFNVGDCADISFPNGYNKANRVFDGYAPAINGTTTQSSFIVKEPIVCEERKDEGIRLFKDDCVGTLRTIDACGDKRVIEPKESEPPKIRWRIRKLMPIECWKLMAFSRSDHNKAAKFVSNSALYKQAGNSIIVNCLVALMSSLFIKDGHKAEVWTKYIPNVND